MNIPTKSFSRQEVMFLVLIVLSDILLFLAGWSGLDILLLNLIFVFMVDAFLDKALVRLVRYVEKKLVTPEESLEIEKAVIDTEKLDMTGAEKKAYVIQHMVSLKYSEFSMSTAIDAIVLRLKLDKVIQ